MKTTCFFCLILCGGAPVPAKSQPASPPGVGVEPIPIRVNRTLPKVQPPKTGLEFSTQPTTGEISRARIFQVALVPIGGEPTVGENAALAGALLGYARRSSPDDFASLTAFLEQHPQSAWRASVLTGLGFEYYNTAHYSLALEAWRMVLEQLNRSVEGAMVVERASEELAQLYARLGRMNELEALLKSSGGDRARSASEKIKMSREALWLMKNQPEISFRCGPMALQSILTSDERLLASCATNALAETANAASTTNGFSLTQVAELSRKIGLNYQMAFKQKAEIEQAFVVPSVVHWKVGHYAAIVRQVGDRYLVEDPTFGNTVWATKQTLEAETSGYFLIPPGDLPPGWRSVDANEGATVHGKGITSGNDPNLYCRNDRQTGGTCRIGMPAASVHLMTVNVSIHDTPLAYTPPVGPPVRFTFRYNSRDPYAEDATFGGPGYWTGLEDANAYPSASQLPPGYLFVSYHTKMTHDWISYLVDSPQSPLADVAYFVGGGGVRTFTGFDTNSQSFAPQQYDQTRLTRTGTDSYEMTFPDGSTQVFAQSDGSVGSGRKVYLTQIADPAGNALTFTYDQALRVVAVTDAIGQVTTVTYGDGTIAPTNTLTRVTDPFGRSAIFDYDKRTNVILEGIITNFFGSHPNYFTNEYFVLTNITDMLGLRSYPDGMDYLGGDVERIVTPYGFTSFKFGGGVTNNTRFAEISHPDGSRERVEYNQTITNIPATAFLSPADFPQGMTVFNFLYGRNTFYWSRTACASGYGDYSKAKIYHWMHGGGGNLTSGLLDSVKEALEGRVWYNYAAGSPAFAASDTVDRPTKVGRVLDDGTTQLYTQGYNDFGHLTNSVDPLGRALSFIYATNGTDLLEIRQTRAVNNELLFRANYNAQHRPLTVVDAAGQTNTLTYNARGQLLTVTNPKGETITYTYDTNGYLTIVDGPLPGTNDTVRATYDFFGRLRTLTGVSGYMLTFDYDALDRVTKITHPDGAFEQFTYDRLDMVTLRDRAGRQTFFEYDNMRQLKKRTDPLGRITRFDWCHCGQLKSLTDPLGRTTTWDTDVQSRPIAKHYADGSKVTYQYENTISRLKTVIDEKQQVIQFAWNRDNTLRAVTYGGAIIPTPGISLTYDPDYHRIVSMTDGTGTTRYSYNPVTATPTLGAGALASVDGPLPNDTITYGYDELGRTIHRAVNGVDSALTFDAAGRLIGVTNALGAFGYAYDGASRRLASKSFPNGQITERGYGNTLQDLTLQRVTHRMGATPISEFLYGHDITRGRITTWSQQAGAQPPDLFTFGYDAANQLLTATVTNTGSLVSTFAYTYDLAGNRLTEQIGASNYTATYNGLNEIRSTTTPGATRTNEWDAINRLVAVNAGNQRTEFTYDGLSRMVAIRKLVDGSEISRRRFVWCNGRICEERDANGAVTKRFFPQGVKLESGPVTGTFFYTRDHLGSIRELTDAGGGVRARYAYDPYGRRAKLTGDVDADFGFAGMFFSAEANLALTHFRAYDPEIGRWLSRDPLKHAEMQEGPNLYTYVRNEPVSSVDRLGLIDSAKAGLLQACATSPVACRTLAKALGVAVTVEAAAPELEAAAPALETAAIGCAETLPAAVAELAPTVEAEAAPVIETEIAPTLEAAGAQIQQTLEDLGDLEPALSDAEIEAMENEDWAELWRDRMLDLRPDFEGDYGGPAGLARTAETLRILDRWTEIKKIFGLPQFPD
jgi:RHS repeat-associated protein